MSEQPITGEEAGGIGRRDFVKKSAILGGMVWAAPAMSTLGSRAFAENGSPPDPNGEVVCTKWFQFKLEGFDLDGGPSLQDCPEVDEGNQCFPEDWNFEWDTDSDYDCVTSGSWDSENLIFTINLTGGRVATLTFDTDYKSATLVVPADCKILSGDAKAGTETAGGGCYSFQNGNPQTYKVTTDLAISNVLVVICCSS